MSVLPGVAPPIPEVTPPSLPNPLPPPLSNLLPINSSFPCRASHCKKPPLTDILEDEKNIIFKIDLPGFTKDEISIELKECCLIVCATDRNIVKKIAEKIEDTKEELLGGVICHKKERHCGAYYRCYSVPKGIKPVDVFASYLSGVLKIVIVKTPNLLSTLARILIN
jgi:HSP20 family molecular chaperone IbpA